MDRLDRATAPQPPPPPNRENEPTDPAKERRELVKDYLEIFGIVAGIIGVVLLVWQSFQMAEATRATRDSVQIMQTQMSDARAQQRARLVIKDMQISIETNNLGFAAVIAYTVENTGQTPAYELGVDEPYYICAGQTAIISTNREKLKVLPSLAKNDPILTRANYYVAIESNVFQNAVVNKLGVQLEWWPIGKQAARPNPSGRMIAPGGVITNGPFLLQMFSEYGMEGEISLNGLRARKCVLYVEVWVSYRDVFSGAWNVGTGAFYNSWSDSFGYRQDRDSDWDQYGQQTEDPNKSTKPN